MKNSPRSIAIPLEGSKYIQFLGGPSEGLCLRSGYVELSPGESVGLHNTGDNEELIVPLSGIGELTCPGTEPLAVAVGCVLHNPPHTPHDVTATGSEPLRYIYIVTSTVKEG